MVDLEGIVTWNLPINDYINDFLKNNYHMRLVIGFSCLGQIA
jgi:hypothetical protein